MKVGLEGLSPGQVVLARLVSGAAVLLAMCAVTRQSLPRQRAVWGHLLVVGLLLCVVPFLLFAWAEQHISSSLASVYNATTPLMTMAVAMLALPTEPRTRDKTLGLLLGFVGVIVVLAPWNGLGHSGLAGQLACLGATACYGMGFTYLRRFVTPLGLPSVSVAAVQVSLAAVVMLALTPIAATGATYVTWRVAVSMLLLGGVGTGLAYLWNTNIVRDWGATTASTVTYVTPVVGVVLGVLLLGESMTWTQPLGGVVIVLGIMASRGLLRLPAKA